ncbi:MAG TPA: four helix bundle protein [Candidatus Paceibacterota bacterium]
MGRGYKDLIVWQKSKDFCVGVYKLTDEFPKSEL